MSIRYRQLFCLIALAAASPAALASFHFMKVVEVYPGSFAAPAAQYVQIQMFAAGQTQLSGHAISVFDASGQLTDTFTFTGAVSNGSNQSTVLIATPQAVAFFGLGADLGMGAGLDPLGGKVCFDAIPVDCMAWGNYSGSSAGVGAPFNATGLAAPGNPAIGLQLGRAAFRRLDIAGNGTVLEASDDTDDSANDFRFGSPLPRNNAGVFGSLPAATCGNHVVEGIEQCDDGNLISLDGCSSTCGIDIATSFVVFHDGFEPD